MRPLLTALIAVALSSAALAQSGSTPLRLGHAFASISYGLYCAVEPDRVEDAPGTASGTINRISGLGDFAFEQALVPAEIGIGFGVLASPQPGTTHGPITITVSHPPYADTGIEVERWITDFDDAPMNLVGFSFERPGELLLGEWTFAAHDQNGSELFQMTFQVVEPALVPHVIETCFGSFLS